MKNYTHAKLNLRAELIACIMKDGENRYGGKGNATVSSPNFRTNAGIRANRLVNGKA